MRDLPNDTESLKALVKQLLEKIAQLEAENGELRRRLGLDSSNTSTGSVQRSHKPPSSDGYKKAPVKPGLPKDKARAKGGQTGLPRVRSLSGWVGRAEMGRIEVCRAPA